MPCLKETEFSANYMCKFKKQNYEQLNFLLESGD